MPMIQVWVEEPAFLTHRGISVDSSYDEDECALFYWYTLTGHAMDEFDVRDLDGPEGASYEAKEGHAAILRHALDTGQLADQLAAAELKLETE